MLLTHSLSVSAFPLLRVVLELEFILGTLGVMWEYTLDNRGPCTHTFRHSFTPRAFTQTLTQVQDGAVDPRAVRQQCYRLHHHATLYLSFDMFSIPLQFAAYLKSPWVLH